MEKVTRKRPPTEETTIQFRSRTGKLFAIIFLIGSLGKELEFFQAFYFTCIMRNAIQVRLRSGSRFETVVFLFVSVRGGRASSARPMKVKTIASTGLTAPADKIP